MVWGDEMTDMLKKLWAEGYSAAQCAHRLTDAHGVTVTRHAVLAKCDRLRRDGDPDAPARRDGAASREGRRSDASRRTTAMLAAAKRREEPKRAPVTSWQQGKPVPVERYVERGDDGATPISSRVTLQALEDHHCRWPVGDPRAASFRFCGCPKEPGLVYCTTHAQRAYPLRYPDLHPGEVTGWGFRAAGGDSRPEGGGDTQDGWLTAVEPSEREDEVV